MNSLIVYTVTVKEDGMPHHRKFEVYSQKEVENIVEMYAPCEVSVIERTYMLTEEKCYSVTGEIDDSPKCA